jgi:hypothetical protein
VAFYISRFELTQLLFVVTLKDSIMLTTHILWKKWTHIIWRETATISKEELQHVKNYCGSNNLTQ